MTLADRLATFDPRRSIRARFAWVLGTSGVALAVLAALAVERYERAQIEATVGQAARQEAQLLARALAVSLNERLLAVRQIATQPVVASGLMEAGDLRALLEQVRSNQPEFVWLAMLDARGVVEVATNAFLQGESLASEPVFTEGRQRPWIGRRHPAGRLAPHMGLTREGEPPQFIDLAVPVLDYQARVIGVVVAELDGQWMDELHRALAGDAAAERGMESLVLGPDGRVDNGPADLRGRPLSALLAQLRAATDSGQTAVLRWPDGRDYLTAAAHDPATAGAPSAGLTLVVRQDAQRAFAAAQVLRQRLLVAGVAASLGFVLLSVWLADRVARPLRALSAAAARRRRGEAVVFPAGDVARGDEVNELAATLQAMDADVQHRAVRFQVLFDGSPDAMYVRVGGQMLLANRACLALYGASDIAELQALPAHALFHPDERDRVERRVHQLNVLRQPVPLLEQRITRLDGGPVDVETTALPFDDGGQPAFHVIMRDITERKRAVAALRRAQDEVEALNADLERRVEARTAQLRAANAELDSFAYAVSHDLRAPLRAMSGFAQALQEDHGAALDAEARMYLDQISLASVRMGELIDGLLTLSRSTRGRMRRDAVDLSALAERALAELHAADPARQVVAQVAPGLAAEGDARMLDVVMRNLLDNAWKYSVHAAAPRIEVGAEQLDGERWFYVRDNGAGFDMAHAARLFKAFQRLHRTDEFPGLGIGLATVQRIVHRHGGAIIAHGAPGQGATFRFTLPGAGAGASAEEDA